jgi:hypothetical protein
MELTPFDPDADANVTPHYVARTSSSVVLPHSAADNQQVAVSLNFFVVTDEAPK